MKSLYNCSYQIRLCLINILKYIIYQIYIQKPNLLKNFIKIDEINLNNKFDFTELKPSYLA